MENEKIRPLGLDPNRLKAYQVLCLPENFDYAASSEDLIDASESADLSKVLKEAGLKCANSFDLGIHARVIERRGIDLWFGFLWLVDHLALPIVIGVLTELLLGKWQSPNQKETAVHLRLRIQRNDRLTNIKYDGDGETLVKLLNGIAGKAEGSSAKEREKSGKGRRRNS